MTLDDEALHADLLAIHSRLGVIEGKVNLVARAEREAFLSLIEKTVRAQPLVGQLYLLLDGQRTQKQMLEMLTAQGVTTSKVSIWRRIGEMETEHGMAKLVQGGAVMIHAKDPEMEKLLNLTKKVGEWLTDMGKVVPAPVKKRRRNKAS
jgi:hypothetical protein